MPYIKISNTRISLCAMLFVGNENQPHDGTNFG